MEEVRVSIKEIYIPQKHRDGVNPETVTEIAESILEQGQKTPIQVRQGKGRLVLVTGKHRLQACKELGEEEITAIFVDARRY